MVCNIRPQMSADQNRFVGIGNSTDRHLPDPCLSVLPGPCSPVGKEYHLSSPLPTTAEQSRRSEMEKILSGRICMTPVCQRHSRSRPNTVTLFVQLASCSLQTDSTQWTLSSVTKGVVCEPVVIASKSACDTVPRKSTGWPPRMSSTATQT